MEATSAQHDVHATEGGWPQWKRRLVSAWLALHLLAVVIAPLAGPPPASDLSRAVAGSLEWYIRPMFLGHGYRFFAPNPGPSHLVEYELIIPNEADPVTGRFPDVDDYWPRLLYHRMFMMSESVNNATLLMPQEEFDARIADGEAEVRRLRSEGYRRQADRIQAQLDLQRQEYARSTETRDLLLEAIANRLALEHGATQVRLYSVEHLIPTPLDVELGMELNDENLWDRRLVYEWQESAE